MTSFNTALSPASLPEAEFDFEAWVRQVKPQLLACVQQSQAGSRRAICSADDELLVQGQEESVNLSED